MKNCCKSGSKTKKCVRKSDNKQFTFPRRFSKKQCLSQKIKGFTMRSSCAPYKDCKRQSGGRMPPSGIDNTSPSEQAMEGSSDLANMSLNDAVLYEDDDPSSELDGLSILDRNIDEEDSGILDIISQISEDQDDVNDLSFGELDDFETEEQTGGGGCMSTEKETDELSTEKESDEFSSRVFSRKNVHWDKGEIESESGKTSHTIDSVDEFKRNHKSNHKYTRPSDKTIFGSKVWFDSYSSGGGKSKKTTQPGKLGGKRKTRKSTKTKKRRKPRSKKQKGGDLNSELLGAIRNGDLEMVKRLLEQGADINKATNSAGDTPLYVASEMGHVDVVTILLERGADINKATNSAGYTPLYVASEAGYEEVVKILLEKGADINKADIDGQTPLMIAVSYGDLEVVEVLLEYGANLNVRTDEGYTVFDMLSDGPSWTRSEIENLLETYQQKNVVTKNIKEYKRPNIPSLRSMAHSQLDTESTSEINKNKDTFDIPGKLGGKGKNKSIIYKMKGRKSRKSRKSLKGGGRKTTCVKQTLKKYTTRKSPPYPANKCKTKKRKGNDGKFYISKAKGGTYKWAPFARHAK